MSPRRPRHPRAVHAVADQAAKGRIDRESLRGIRVRPATFDEMEAALRQRLEALPRAARAELIHVLRLPDLERAERIGEFWGHPETRTFAELLIDCEEDRALAGGARRAARNCREAPGAEE
jgi:hypothetical protein